MKNNILKLVVLFFAFVATIFTTTIILFLKVYLGVKITVFIFGVTLSIFIFMQIQKTNSRPNNNKELEQKIKNEPPIKNYKSKHLLCPKCLKPYDGDTCFYCGFTKNHK